MTNGDMMELIEDLMFGEWLALMVRHGYMTTLEALMYASGQLSYH